MSPKSPRSRGRLSLRMGRWREKRINPLFNSSLVPEWGIAKVKLFSHRDTEFSAYGGIPKGKEHPVTLSPRLAWDNSSETLGQPAPARPTVFSA